MLTALGVPDKSQGAGKIAVCDSLADCVAGADLVVETVPEKLEIKAAVFKEIDALVGKDCIIAIQHLRHPDHQAAGESCRRRSASSACTGRTRRTSSR